MYYRNHPFILKEKYRLVALIAFLFITVGLKAQNINLKAENTAIRDVIETLQTNYGYSFSIRTSEVNVNKLISINVTNADIKSVLDKIFASEQVSCQIDGKLISITEGNPTQPRKTAVVNGQVIDDIGPVIGASVIVKGTKKGVITDADGKFTLDCGVPTPVVIEVAFLGMTTQVITVKDPATPLSVTLHPDADVLDDVVVVAYGSQRRELVTNAIASFKPDDNSARTALSPTELLQGRIAGVNISTSSGNLGSSERMSIRGSSSLSASNQPLYVIDGIPLNNESGSLYSFGEDLSSLSVLNLSDIESIEVLKDAASAAIYGSRGTNGVILITTRQGRDGKSEIKVNYNFGMSQFNNRNRIGYANSSSWIEVYN